MKILTVLARLLDYPTAELQDFRQELITLIREERNLSKDQRAQLVAFTEYLCTANLLDVQENYVGLFDRGRALSLLLFEHVHGESRDRGQAMVDLLAEYEQAGLLLNARELPDHLPLFLEFLSTREAAEARQWLESVNHILALLSERLKQRDSDYHLLFDSLLTICAADVDRRELAEKVAAEQPDHTPEALDQVWEEEMVKFIDDQSTQACGQSNIVRQRRDELGKVQTLHLQDPVPAKTGTYGA